MDEDDLRQMLVVVDLLTAVAVLGIGRTNACELVRTGRWPTPVVRLVPPETIKASSHLHLRQPSEPA